jgi:protein-L-isoaspartate(D-aspartate) O-methyltransferase
MTDFAEPRARMVADQLVRRGIGDPRVLDAMRRVPRHLFVPPGAEGLAYADRALPIGSGQTISQPFIVAVMTEALALEGSERVLEIGTGSGYQAAILAELAEHVVSVERRPELAAAARERLASLGYTNITVVEGDGTTAEEGQGAQYHAILVAAGAPRVPPDVQGQLADGGRLLIPIGPRDQQQLMRITRMADRFMETALDHCVFVPLIGRDAWPPSPDGG